MSGTWTDASGKVWPLVDMTDRHINASIAFMERTISAGEKYVQRLEMFEGGADPDGLEGMEEANRQKLNRARAKLKELRQEQSRRALAETEPRE